MSFARMGQDGSQVYVYEIEAGSYVCCWCLLHLGARHVTETARGVVSHLKEHRAAGHVVPQYTIDDLEEIASCLE